MESAIHLTLRDLLTDRSHDFGTPAFGGVINARHALGSGHYVRSADFDSVSSPETAQPNAFGPIIQIALFGNPDPRLRDYSGKNFGAVFYIGSGHSRTLYGLGHLDQGAEDRARIEIPCGEPETHLYAVHADLSLTILVHYSGHGRNLAYDETLPADVWRQRYPETGVIAALVTTATRLIALPATPPKVLPKPTPPPVLQPAARLAYLPDSAVVWPVSDPRTDHLRDRKNPDMTSWTGTDPSWIVSLGRSPDGNAAFTTAGLAAHGLPDLVTFAPPECLTDETMQGVPAEMLITIADAVIQLGHIPTPADDFCLGAPDGTRWPMAFDPLDYVAHDITAALDGRAQTIGLVQVYPPGIC